MTMKPTWTIPASNLSTLETPQKTAYLMTMPKLTPQNREQVLSRNPAMLEALRSRGSASDREYLFEDMPEPEGEPQLSPMEQLAEFRAISEELGGLVRPVDAAELLGISYSTVRSYILTGSLEAVPYFGAEWISGRSIAGRLVRKPKPGRPRKVSA